MNGKPDWFLRTVLVAILLVLAAHFYAEAFWPVGRYAQHQSEHAVVVLDTRTGAMYAGSDDGKSIISGNIVERAKKQKPTK